VKILIFNLFINTQQQNSRSQIGNVMLVRNAYFSSYAQTYAN